MANRVATTSAVERARAVERPGCIRSSSVRAQIVVWMMSRMRTQRRKEESLGMVVVVVEVVVVLVKGWAR